MAQLQIRLGRCCDRRVVCTTLAALLSVLSSTAVTRAWAGDPDVTAKTPVFFDHQPGRALVYFVNDLYSAETRVYLDNRAIGILPRKSYEVAMVEPGYRLVWGTSEARWYEFRAGGTYLLRLVKVGTFATAWVSDNPGMIGALVVDKKLAYASTSAEARARLQAKADAKYKSAVKAAGAELALPYRKRFHALELNDGSPGSMQAGR